MAMATLSIINTISLESQGRTTIGKHGTADDGMTTALEVDVTGTKHEVIGSLATAAVATVYDDDDDVPADWDYAFYWADQDSYIQIIGPTMHVVFKVEAYQPFVLPGFDGLTAAANSTAITGGAEPSPSDIDSIVIGNYSGSTMNYQFVLID
jgi:hypothetical protein